MQDKQDEIHTIDRRFDFLGDIDLVMILNEMITSKSADPSDLEFRAALSREIHRRDKLKWGNPNGN